ncbi:CAP domain-containing protein [Natrialbaceae archaeon GCM10025810]|uniref:CAP domain-containing protein n=1 Tax=Halovalidus salilacus TaxID=3075124 RepID=UPI00360ADE30
MNEERADHGEGQLSFDTELRDVARDHSADMAERDYFAHDDPEGNDFSDRYADAGYRCSVNGYTGGENLAQTWYDRPVETDSGTVEHDTERELADGLVDQWMNSPGHRDNLLGSQWENEGIGVYVTDDGKVYATQNFC